MDVNFLNQDINKQDLNSEVSSGYSLEKTEWQGLSDITPVTFKQFADFQLNYVDQAVKGYIGQFLNNRHPDNPPVTPVAPVDPNDGPDNSKEQLLLKIGEFIVNAAKHAEVAAFNKIEEQNPNLTPEKFASTQADYVGNHAKNVL